MANCCVCGNIISVMNSTTPLSEKYPSYHLCPTCAIAKKNIEAHALTEKENIKYLSSFLIKINDPVVRYCINELVSYDPDEHERQIAEEKERRAFLINSIMITSGFNFEGWQITSYMGFISAEVAIGMGYFKAFAASFSDVFGVESVSLSNKLAEARAAVLDRIRIEAYKCGANAIIGIDVDYTMFGETIVGVIANGTAVKIQKSL